MHPRMPLTSGTRLGAYEIQSSIGAGGMGEVYRARDTRLDRTVAIKILPASVSSDPDRLLRFQHEARILSTLNHPNVLAIFDVGEQNDVRYLVSEFLDGRSMREALATGALPRRKATEYALEIAKGLAAAHEKAVVHRDLKPDNIFITGDERVKILDFGLAKQTATESAADESPTMTVAAPTTPGTVMGTVGYMSPEQVRGQTLDHRSDIFSFGAVLYEMVSGQRAFSGESSVEIMNAILKEDVAELSTSGGQASPGLDRIIRRCLEKKPERRFQSASDLAFAIDARNLRHFASGSGHSPAHQENADRTGHHGPRDLALGPRGTLPVAIQTSAHRSGHLHPGCVSTQLYPYGPLRPGRRGGLCRIRQRRTHDVVLRAYRHTAVAAAQCESRFARHLPLRRTGGFAQPNFRCLDPLRPPGAGSTGGRRHARVARRRD